MQKLNTRVVWRRVLLAGFFPTLEEILKENYGSAGLTLNAVCCIFFVARLRMNFQESGKTIFRWKHIGADDPRRTEKVNSCNPTLANRRETSAFVVPGCCHVFCFVQKQLQPHCVDWVASSSVESGRDVTLHSCAFAKTLVYFIEKQKEWKQLYLLRLWWARWCLTSIAVPFRILINSFLFYLSVEDIKWMSGMTHGGENFF